MNEKMTKAVVAKMDQWKRVAYHGPVQNKVRKFLGVTFAKHIPGLSKDNYRWAVLRSKNPTGLTLVSPWGIFAAIRYRGRWHIIKSHSVTSAFYKLTLMNAQQIPVSEWENEKWSVPFKPLTKEQAKEMVEKESNQFVYDVRKDTEFYKSEIKPATGGEKYDYSKDPHSKHLDY